MEPWSAIITEDLHPRNLREPAGRIGSFLAVLLLAVPYVSGPLLAFPPYRSTDADTAEPGILESRFGLVQVDREGQDNDFSTPLLRFNLGLPGHLEIESEFEFNSQDEGLEEAALGIKWIPFHGSFDFGIETLALLPVNGGNQVGVESILLATFKTEALRIHVNLGGFSDTRRDDSANGWKGGILTEFPMGRFRPGLELFARKVDSRPLEASIGPGIIIDLGGVDLRTGLGFGITDEASDLRASFWLTTKVPYRRQR